MNRTTLIAAALTCAASAAHAQTPMGLAHNWEATTPDGTSFFSRSALGLGAGVVLNRYDGSDLRFYGANAAGVTELRGWNVVLQDLDGSTPETLRFVVHDEDSNNRDFPATTAALTSRSITFTPGPAQVVRINVTATFSPPLQVAPNQDVFVGVQLAAATASDGLLVGMVSAAPVQGSTVFDVPGPAGFPGTTIAQDSYVCAIPIGMAPVYGSGTLQMRQELILPAGAPGGMPLTRTNQTSYPPSNAPLGTTDLLSGMHPDIARGDDIGFVVRVDTRDLPVGAPVFFLMSLAPAGNPQPLAQIPLASAPGTRGVLGLDLNRSVTFLGFVAPAANPILPTGQNNEGEAVLNIDMASARAAVAALPGHLEVWWQGIVLNTAAGGPPFDLRATGLAVQRLKP